VSSDDTIEVALLGGRQRPVVFTVRAQVYKSLHDMAHECRHSETRVHPVFLVADSGSRLAGRVELDFVCVNLDTYRGRAFAFAAVAPPGRGRWGKLPPYG